MPEVDLKSNRNVHQWTLKDSSLIGVEINGPERALGTFQKFSDPEWCLESLAIAFISSVDSDKILRTFAARCETALDTLENHCSRTAQSSRGGCSRQVYKIGKLAVKKGTGVLLRVREPTEAKGKAAKAVLNHPIRILIMNCQSIKNKKAGLHTIIVLAKPGIILGNESWLTPNIKNSEIFLDSFDAVRKYRASDAHGGVFIAFKRDLLCTETPELDTNCEIVWCKMNIFGCRTLYLGSFYRPLTRLIMIILRSLTHPYLGLCRIETLMFWSEEISIAAI